MKELKFLLCEKCKKMVAVIDDTPVPAMCCGQKMTVLEAGTTDGAVEKHVPVAEISDGKLLVKVGSAEHPMTEGHHIALIAVLFDDDSFVVKKLDHLGKPEAVFPLGSAKPVAVYEYCNLHGLWKLDI